MVVRIGYNTLFNEKLEHSLITNEHEVSEPHGINRLHRTIINIRFCDNLDPIPNYFDKQFSIEINNVKCYVLHRSIECDSGG